MSNQKGEYSIKKISKAFNFFFLMLICLFFVCSCDASGSNLDARTDISEIPQQLKSVMVDSATLSSVRPSSNELSEKEIVVKLLDTVNELGYNFLQYTMDL